MHHQAVIHVVDDDEAYRIAVTRLLQNKGYQIAAYASAEEFLAASAGGRGCVLLDVRMPGLSGLQVQERLAAVDETLPIIFVTGHGDIPMCARAIKSGAEDFLVKPAPRQTLVAAIERALQRQDSMLEDRGQMKELQQRRANLTRREVEVFERVVVGKVNREIADELGTTERTIKAHRQQVMEKMRAGSLAELVGMARMLQDSKPPLR